MYFFRRLRRFLAFMCLGSAGLLVFDAEPAAQDPFAPSFSAAQSFIGESPEGVAATPPTTAPASPLDEPPPEPVNARAPAVTPAAPEEAIARALAEQNRALQTMLTALNGTLDDVETRLKAPPLWTGLSGAPVGAGIAVPLVPPPEPAIHWKGLIDRPEPPVTPAGRSARAQATARLAAEIGVRLFPAPPRLEAMRLNLGGLEMAARGGRHHAR